MHGKNTAFRLAWSNIRPKMTTLETRAQFGHSKADRYHFDNIVVPRGLTPKYEVPAWRLACGRDGEPKVSGARRPARVVLGITWLHLLAFLVACCLLCCEQAKKIDTPSFRRIDPTAYTQSLLPRSELAAVRLLRQSEALYQMCRLRWQGWRGS